jgi:hypothetical protein
MIEYTRNAAAERPFVWPSACIRTAGEVMSDAWFRTDQTDDERAYTRNRYVPGSVRARVGQRNRVPRRSRPHALKRY